MSRQKKWILLDNYKRNLYIRNKIKRLLLKSFKSTQNTSLSRKYLAYINLIKLPRISSIGSLNNRCTWGGRIWSTNKRTGLGRFVIRETIYKSNIPGFRRASW